MPWTSSLHPAGFWQVLIAIVVCAVLVAWLARKGRRDPESRTNRGRAPDPTDQPADWERKAIEAYAEIREILAQQRDYLQQIKSELAVVRSALGDSRADLAEHLRTFQGVPQSVAKIQRHLEGHPHAAAPPAPPPPAMPHQTPAPPRTSAGPEPALSQGPPMPAMVAPSPPTQANPTVADEVRRWIRSGASTLAPLTDALGRKVYPVRLTNDVLILGDAADSGSSELLGSVDASGDLQIFIGLPVVKQYQVITSAPLLGGELGRVFERTNGDGFIECARAEPIAGQAARFRLRDRGRIAQMKDVGSQ